MFCPSYFFHMIRKQAPEITVLHEPQEKEMLEKFLSCLLLDLLVLPLTETVLIDSFVSKEIKNYGKCPWSEGPTINITHKENYESITICWRFSSTAYPHCPGRETVPLYVESFPKKWMWEFEFRVYAPISGMSEDGKHAGWFGFKCQETEKVLVAR